MSQQRLVHIKTSQHALLKGVFDSMAAILSDIPVQFFPDQRMQVLCMDCSRVSFVHLILDGFEEFHVVSEVKVGLYIGSLNKILKSCSSGDILTMELFEGREDELIFSITNTSRGYTTTYTLKTLDTESLSISVPNEKFGSVLSMPSNDLLNIFRHCSFVSDTVSISSDAHNIAFEAKGEIGAVRKEVKKCVVGGKLAGSDCNDGKCIIDDDESDDGDEKARVDAIAATEIEEEKEEQPMDEEENDPSNATRGSYALKFLCYFAKTACVSETAELYLKNEFPIILKYRLGSLGMVQYALAPKIEEDDED